MRPWISWYTFSGGTRLSTSIGLFEYSSIGARGDGVPDESWQRTNLKRAGIINHQWPENNIFLYHRLSGWWCCPESRRQDAKVWAWGSGGVKVFTDEIVPGVGVCFGAIPTHSELLIWRISCVAITIVPIYTYFGYALAIMMDNSHSTSLVLFCFYLLLCYIF